MGDPLACEPRYTKLEISNNNNSITNNKDVNSTILIEDKSNPTIEEEDYNKIGYKTIYNSLITNILNSSIEEPKSFKEVLLHKEKDHYLDAMKLEINNLIQNNTWNIIYNTTIKPIKGIKSFSFIFILHPHYQYIYYIFLILLRQLRKITI